jgi:predicted ATPase
VLLRGLSEQETAAYIRGAANVQPSPELVRRVHIETEGNPFFLSEVVNLMAEEGAFASNAVGEVRIPQGVREALGRRLDRLSPEANELLSLAAVIGREFSHELLRILAALDDDALLRLVEEALKARDRGDERPWRVPLHARPDAGRAIRGVVDGAARADAWTCRRGARSDVPRQP